VFGYIANLHPQIILIIDTLMDRNYKIISKKPGERVGRGVKLDPQYWYGTSCRGVSHSSQGIQPL